MRSPSGRLWVPCLLLPIAGLAQTLVTDPSFEQPKEKDRWGLVFVHWGGWMYEGDCAFRVSDLAHSGQHSMLMTGGNNPKIRCSPADLTLEPGRYRITAWIRGLDIGTGIWNQTTEFQFEEKYIGLKKNGTFGWTPLTYVGEVKAARKFGHPSFGLMAPGYLWVDDVSVEKVGDGVALTPEPVLGQEEAPIAPPGPLTDAAVRCPECAYRNLPAWGRCYACGSPLEAPRNAPTGPPARPITSFEDKNPFDGGTLVDIHTTDGAKALRVDKNWVSMDAPQDWSGYDYVKADCFTDAKAPLQVYFEVRDSATADYWTRVNYTTVVPPGASTLVIPTALYVGEKSRPGRPLIRTAITRMVYAVSENPEAPLYLDNIRLERDTETPKVLFDGLWAFDLGTGSSPLMEGFQPLDVSRAYSPGRGYGWKNARFWRAFDVLQPDPLYEDFICVEQGGLAIDVPNGRYHVFVNMDSPSGFWGEVQRYRKRALIVEGEAHEDTMDLDSFKQRYYRFWDVEDLPGENTFDKYQRPYFTEKELDVEVTDGQLNIDFSGENWGCCVSAIIAYPETRAAEGKRFLDFVRERRRFHFDNYFKRVLHQPAGETPQLAAADKTRGFVVFARDPMQPVYYNDRPLPGERTDRLAAAGFAGERVPVTLAVLPLQDLGTVKVTAAELRGPGNAAIPASAVSVGFVSNRLSRVTMEGSVYTIEPRLIMPRPSVAMPAGVTRRFWLTVSIPDSAAPGQYRGQVTVAAAEGGTQTLLLVVTVHRGTLDTVDVPAGPWGHTIDLPWDGAEAAAWNTQMAEKSVQRLRLEGFTTCSGLPVVNYRGWKNGAPDLDFSVGDAQMQRLKAAGFNLPVVTYCQFGGLNTYYKDEAAMKAAGFTDYSDFIRALFSAIQAHADAAGWLSVYWNLGDEPIGDDLTRSAENAEAYRKAFATGPPFFTAASSFSGDKADDPHFRLSKALHVADWNGHDEASVKLQHNAGSDWAFYNGGNRWTYGVYLYKAAKQFGLKFRLSRHWNVVAGDPYYALDCREDDYAWCNSSPDGELIPSVHFQELILGLGDYRRMLTLQRLVKAKPGTPAAQTGQAVLDAILGGFHLGQRELTEAASYAEIRTKLDAAIDALR
ncbi:MAG: hypothetical protein HYU66_14790 [Armatimonadetes bacterium]|nr:hypothetical protein [Armatimonadota bacterium]